MQSQELRIDSPGTSSETSSTSAGGQENPANKDNDMNSRQERKEADGTGEANRSVILERASMSS